MTVTHTELEVHPDRGSSSDGAGGTEATPAGPAPTLVALPTRPVGSSTEPRRRRVVPKGIERLAGVVLLIAFWELASRLGWIGPEVLAGPSTVLTAGADLARDGTLLEALWASLQRVLWGLAFGIPIGVALALASGLTRIGDLLIDTNVQMLRFVPIIALQPLLILSLGIGETAKISLIVLGVAFPIYVNTVTAIRSIDPGYGQLADVVELSRWQRIRHIVLPGALPGFLVGLRLASAIAWLILVFAEQINATSGIGYLVIRAQTFFQSDVVVVGIVVYALLGLLSDVVIRALDRRVLRWQPGR